MNIDQYNSIEALKRLIEDIHLSHPKQLITSTGNVYGQNYITVRPEGGGWLDMETWCWETFGSPGSDMWGVDDPPIPAARWYNNNRKFWFRDEKDASMFILRWS
jgi:hypothetical protein